MNANTLLMRVMGVLCIGVACALITVAGRIERITCLGADCTVETRWLGLVPVGTPITTTNITSAGTRTETGYRSISHYLVLNGAPPAEIRTWSARTARVNAETINRYLEAGFDRLEGRITNMAGVVVGAVIVPAMMFATGGWLMFYSSRRQPN